MEPTGIPSNWASYVFGLLVAALMWVVRGHMTDMKKLKATHMTRAEISQALADQAEATAKLIAAHQTSTATSFAELRTSGEARQLENTGNFREIRARLDALNDTLIKVALK
jgi:hypothetical protein